MSPADRDLPDDEPADELERLAEEFAFRLAGGEEVDVEAFVADVPTEVRGEVEERCKAILGVRRSIRTGSGSGVGIAPGEELGKVGEFRVLRELGRGGMGVVYLAHQPSLRRDVALKVLSTGADLTDRAVRRFHREAVSAAKLRHPGIVPVFSVGEAEGRHYIAMEFVEGLSLAQHLDRAREPATPLEGPFWRLGGFREPGYGARIARIAASIAEALQYAHDQGVIHRDVKPQNVQIDQEGRPHLLDFGLAKDLSLQSISRSGDMAGTIYYMSPEQAMSKRVQVDHRTDIFSLGVMLYEMLTVRRPFEGDTHQRILYEISFKDPTAIRRVNPAIHRDLETICFKAMEKRPDRRFQTAGEMARELRRFLNHESILTRPPAWPVKAGRAMARHKALSSALSVALVALLALPLVAGRMVEARWRAGLLEEVAALESSPPGPVEPELAEAAAAALAELEAGGVDLEGEGARIAEGGRERLAQEKARMREALQEDLQLGLAHEDDEGMHYQSDPHLLRALLAAERLRRLDPDDPELKDLASIETALPRLTLIGGRPGARVLLAPVDLRDGTVSEAQTIGVLPMREVPVPSGYYRVVVDAGEAGTCELTRLIDRRGAIHELTVQLRPTAEVVADMVLIPAGSLKIGIARDDTGVYLPREVAVDGFWIDPCEVSNGQYQAFLDATGRSAPDIWGTSRPAGWEDLPVVCINTLEAQAYAEWSGKRLVTRPEWELAARGTRARRFPWTDDPTAVVEHGNLGGPEPTDWDHAWQAYPIYLANARPVRSHPEARTPEGLYHMLGNVFEFTETPHVIRLADRYQPMLFDRVLVGGAWNLNRSTASLPEIAHTQVNYGQNFYGIRCAKSEGP